MASSARLDELKKKFDENPRRYFAPLANEHRKSGDLDQAIALCRTHLPQQPGHISGHIVLAQALFEAGSLEESREIFHSALGLDPENLIALRYLGDIAKEASDLVTARQWYERVLEVDPRNEEIAQLVRDLDAPRPAAEERAESIEVEDPSAAASPPTAFAAAPAPTTPENDARFAPLSLDELDVDETTSTAAPNEPVAATAGAWDAPADASDLSMLDTGIDPFDLDPAGSVDALLDGHDPAATEDFFLTELSGATAPIDAAEPAVAATEEDLGSWAPPVSAAPNAPETPTGSEAALDEGEFYLEPPPPEPETAATEDAAPVASSADTRPADDRHQVSMPGLDAFAAEYSLPDADASSAAPATPNADALAQFAAQETAEWQPPEPETAQAPSQTAADELGLEVMEFVPPSREPASAPAAPYTQDSSADPFTGRTLDAPAADASAAPAAFVTETMAELYLQQGFRNEALGVYRELLARNPSDASLRERIEQIESGSLSSIGMAAVSENVVESAIKRHSARPARSVRSFFASLAGRRAPVHYDAAEPTTGGEADTGQDTPAGEWSPQIEADSRGADTAPPSYELTPASDERTIPSMSAAETLANFDPFAEPDESAVAPTDASSPAPNEAQAELATDPMAEFDAADLSPWGSPTLELPTSAMPTVEPPVSETPATETATIESPESEAPSPAPLEEAPPAHRSLEDLFPETPVAPRAEVAAQTFATAFGRSEPQGRPTRAASNELSLDHVFRGAPEGAPPADGGFSFDQFFSDSRSSGGDTNSPATTAHETGHNGGSGDAHDIEQFTAWLEGLKKK